MADGTATAPTTASPTGPPVGDIAFAPFNNNVPAAIPAAIFANGVLRSPPLAILNALVLRKPNPVNIPLKPTVSAAIVAPAIINCF